MAAPTELDHVLTFAGQKIGRTIVSNDQKRNVESYSEGKDVFVSLPTGAGKSFVVCRLPLLKSLAVFLTSR